MVDKVRKRLASWKKSFFSKVGRLTLIRFVLSGIPTYYFSLLRVLNLVCKIIERSLCVISYGKGLMKVRGRTGKMRHW